MRSRREKSTGAGVARTPFPHFGDVGGRGFVGRRVVTKKGAAKNAVDSGRLVVVDDIGKAFYVLITDADERGIR